MARVVTWVCDKCGAKKSDGDTDNVHDDFIDDDSMSAWEGWVTIHLVKDGESKHIDLCPKCANKLEFN
jgi:hypothetical protein